MASCGAGDTHRNQAAAIDRVDFLAGARAGSILVIEAAMNAAFNSSMEVGVSVLAEDPFTFLAAVAGVTHRVRLGTLVACVGYRHPMLLARVAADVDP